jgi:hypothetical protein
MENNLFIVPKSNNFFFRSFDTTSTVTALDTKDFTQISLSYYDSTNLHSDGIVISFIGKRL